MVRGQGQVGDSGIEEHVRRTESRYGWMGGVDARERMSSGNGNCVVWHRDRHGIVGIGIGRFVIFRIGMRIALRTAEWERS